MKVTQTATDDMPYEKFLKKGAESLTDAELLAVLLRTGPNPGPEAALLHQRCPALALAEKLLSMPKGAESGLAGLCRMAPRQLMKIRGIGEVKAVRICCVTELARRIALNKRREMPAFPGPETAAAYCRPLFYGEDSMVEKSVLLLLDTKGKLIHEKILSVGTVNSTFVSPREVFVQALKYQAVHMLLLHNHPSGDEKPSREDMEITRRLAELGTMMELLLTDHIIVTQRSYYSFREAGLL